MSDTERVRFEPEVTAVSEPFWAATEQRRLVLPWCEGCGAPHWYPRLRCPRCGGGDMEWRDAAGAATVAAVSRQHRPGWPGLAERVPYDVGLVDLDEGVRMFTTLVADAGAIGVPATGEPFAVGERVAVCWEPLSDGRHLACFAPLSS
jgi:uncharacterized protein